MSVWTALRRIVAKHLLYHMVIPLTVGALAEIVVISMKENLSLVDAIGALRRPEHVIPLVAVVIAYLIVMVIIISKETTTPFETASYTIVEDELERATGYFALCAIPLREWYEPAAFKYFMLLAAKKCTAKSPFKYERVLIFPNEKDRGYAEATTLDRHHAQALATAHKTLEIPLGWLGPDDLRTILSAIRPEHLHALERVPPALSRFRALLTTPPPPVELDFAVLERGSEARAVILFPFKKPRATVLEGDQAEPFLAFADAVKSTVFQSDGVTIRKKHSLFDLLAK